MKKLHDSIRLLIEIFISRCDEAEKGKNCHHQELFLIFEMFMVRVIKRVILEILSKNLVEIIFYLSLLNFIKKDGGKWPADVLATLS